MRSPERKAREEARRAHMAAYDRDQAPVLEALRGRGLAFTAGPDEQDWVRVDARKALAKLPAS
jgi:hypothetical protein